MQFITITMSLMGLLATQAAATIAFGTQGNNKVAWIAGDNPCTNANLAVISTTSQNPCNRNFKLHNGFTYQLRDCGTPSFALWNGDGSYNHIANSHSQTITCNTHPDVHEEWQF